MQQELMTLANGLNVCFINFPGNTASSVQVWFRAGSSLETKENEGIAHFLEHMFFKGTPTRPGQKIATEVEGFGGELNAFTSFDYTCYYINTPSKKLLHSTEILLDMVSNPLFTNEDIPSERSVVFEEYRRSQDRPSQYNFQKIQETFLQGGYQHPILGREETIQAFSREQLIEFRNQYYNLSNTLLLIAGDLKDKEALIKKIESFTIPKGPTSSFLPIKTAELPKISVHHGNLQMAQLTMVIEAPSVKNDQSINEEMALSVLAYGETSYLHRSLVLKGSIANGCSTSTLFMNDGGLHFLSINFPLNNLQEVTDRLLLKLTERLDKGLEDEHILKIKNQYVASKIYDLESVESFSFSIGHSFAQAGDVTFEEKFLERVRNCTTSQVNSGLSTLLSKKIHVALQIPKDQKLEKYKKQIQNFSKKINSLNQDRPKKQKAPKILQTSEYDPSVTLYEILPGVNLIYRYNSMAPTFVAHCYLRGGVTNETTKNNGSYNLLSALLPKGFGTTKAEDIRMICEEHSASLSPFSGKNAYGMTLHGQSIHFEKLMALLLGSITEPTLPTKEFEHEKKMVLRALKNQQEDASKHCFSLFAKLNFGKHPYAMNLLGTKESLKNISTTTLQKSHQQTLKNSPILFTVCGNVTLERILPILQNHLQKLSPRKNLPPKKQKFVSEKNKNVFLKFKREQTQLFMGFPIKEISHFENTVLKMFATFLSGQGSPLFVEVRDRKGLCYSVSPVHMNALEGGFFGIYIACGKDKTWEAKETILSMLKGYQKEGLTKEDFQQIKTMIAGQNELAVQTNEDYANLYSIATFQHLGFENYHQKQIEIQNIEYEKFQKELKSILKRPINTVIVGESEGRPAGR